MKNILKKNQVIITALVIMIAVAGYLNFTQKKAGEYSNVNMLKGSDETDNDEEILNRSDILGTKVSDKIIDTAETSGIQEEATEAEAKNSQALTDISDEELEKAVTVNDSNEITKNSEDKKAVTKTANNKKNVTKKSKKVGESVLVSSTISSDFFNAAKLKREQTRAKNKDILMELIDDANIKDEQKENAIDSMIQLTSLSEKETATEILLEAKGINGAVVSILDGSVEVVVNGNNLSEQQIAQIEDIVKRKTNISADKIVISPIGVEADKE